MSDHTATPPTEELFTKEEVKQFDQDDAEAGRAIGKMLSALFLYTVVAMSISAIITYYWITTASVN